MNYKELTKDYSKDYFDIATEKTIRIALQLIESIEKGEFEYDTCDTDRLLYALRYAVNEIDI
jgi:hypothetical protein